MSLFRLVSILFALLAVSDVLGALRSDQKRRERVARWIAAGLLAVDSLLLLTESLDAWIMGLIIAFAIGVAGCQTLLAYEAFDRLREVRAKDR